MYDVGNILLFVLNVRYTAWNVPQRVRERERGKGRMTWTVMGDDVM